MSPSCPHCSCLEVEPLAGLFESAPTVELVRLAAPPKKISCLLIVQIWFLATMAMDVTAQLLRWTEITRGYVLTGIFIASALAVAMALAYNRCRWRSAYRKWQHSYRCTACGGIFESG